MTIISFPGIRKGCSCKASDWLTLPVAPQAAARIRFCGEAKLPPAVPLHGTLSWIADLEARGKSVAGLNIDGPGDPLATWPMTRDMLTMLRERYPVLPMGITTLGLGLAGYAGELSEQGVSRVTLLINALDPDTIRKMYTWIRPGKLNTPLARAAGILVKEQEAGIASCRTAGIPVFIRTTVYSGFNEHDVEKIARRICGLGVESITLVPGRGWLKGNEKLSRPSPAIMEDLATKAARHLGNVCLEAEADQCDIIPLSSDGALAMPRPTVKRPNAAVLSSNGMDIDLHLGQAIRVLIYGPREDGLHCLLETRDLPEPGSGSTRWNQVAEILDDCFVLLAASAGQKPRDILGRHGLALLLIEDNVEGTVDVLYGCGKKGKHNK